MASYRVVRLALDTVSERQTLVDPNTGVTSVHVLALTVGADVEIGIGSGGQLFPIFAGFAADLCPAELGPVIVSNLVAVAGGEMVLLVWTGGGSSGGPQ